MKLAPYNIYKTTFFLTEPTLRLLIEGQDSNAALGNNSNTFDNKTKSHYLGGENAQHKLQRSCLLEHMSTSAWLLYTLCT
jgi:hypothetical protein